MGIARRGATELTLARRVHVRHVSPTRVIAALAAGIVTVSLVGVGVASAAPVAPEPSVSYYLTTAPDSEVCDMGRLTGAGQTANTIDYDAFVFLHFFAPVRFANGDYGGSRGTAGAPQRISGVTGPNATGIELTLQRFANCYANNNPSGSTVKIVAGVTNDRVNDPIESVTSGHGRAWGNLIVRMNNWAANQGLASQVSFNGGMDAEEGLANNMNQIQNWETGYRVQNGNWNLFFYGGAAGCPSDKDPNNTCNFPANDLIGISWSLGEVTPFPQIYDEEPPEADPPTSVNAQQWQRLSKRSYNNGTTRMNFSGGLSQFESCKGRETDPDCLGLDLRPKESWRDLWDEINCTYDGGAPCPTQDDLRWTTSISDDQLV